MALDVVDTVPHDGGLERASSIYRRAAIVSAETGQPEQVHDVSTPHAALADARHGLKVIDGGER